MKNANFRPTVLEINLKKFKSNIKKIQTYLGNDVQIMPIVKANAYGTYINRKLNVLNNFNILGVATVSEALKIRKIGYKKDIFVLNQPYIDEIDNIQYANVTVGVSSLKFIEALGKTNRITKVHIEIDTGMGRTGIQQKEINLFFNTIKKYKNIIVEGIYTHLSSADFDFEYTNKQLKLFDKAVNVAKKEFNTIKYIHAFASSGIINFNTSKYNLVRPGILMYGYMPSENIKNFLGLEEIAIFKSKIVFLKTVPANTSIGYSQKFITKRKSIIATVPIGYADGLRRELSNKGKVYINGNYANIIGNICMDSFMVDVTEINPKEGMEVIIWDNVNIKLDEIAKQCGTINYEILSGIPERVKRKFIY